ncbi:MAG TPA: sulfate/molybdate ABC transporter ATP-binding protein [Phenylobacterium sp.]|jgi:sulfate transport system ATP-binding protein|uniref:sulfate/molybdate ABC transporter ATP-binding protein n=1 Tax=Phenylobacterium sp. TaxID=1871053 RepID=UPI002B575380|nr:sulfate/molybdate ABC transporter ATP-binding protein [Phenylobacterium sp.]HXA39864.1 sulfate/molybdate ABC transporter ATP-binding protein [Phenylobacterium sp.]
MPENSLPTADTDARRHAKSTRSLEISGVSKSFGRFPALNDVSLQAKDKEFLALLGPSGSGKTTLLRVLAGLERPDAGEVRFDGEDFLSIPVRRRQVGMVFQHYALFRHMTVAQNIAFGLTVRPRRERPSKSETAERVADLLSLVQLEGLGGRFPAQLSGGQRQRVALARALAIEPKMLLLDEPFGALDAQVRRELRRWLRDLHDRAGVTTVFVTHDQEEALDLADRVAILKDGRLIQLGTPNEVYEKPADPFVYDFLGAACRLPGVVASGRLTVADWETKAPADAPQGRVEMFFRPDEVMFAPLDGAGLAAEVKSVVQRGPDARIECLIEGRLFELEARGPGVPSGVSPGLSLRIKPLRPKIYPATAEAAS